MSNIKIGFFPMTGDLLHCGHLKAIEWCKKNCDVLIIGLNCGGKKDTIESIYERFVRLDSCKWVDKVVPYAGEEDLVERVLGTLDFDIYFCGEDHFGKLAQEGVLKELGKEIGWIPRRHGLSSSELKRRMNNVEN